MTIENSEAIILNGIKYGDSSKILRVLTRNNGKLSLIAKGAYRKNNKFGASIEPSTISNIIFYFKNNRDLQQLTESSFEYKYKNVFKEIERICTNYLILEFLDFTQKKDYINHKVFDIAKYYLIQNDKKEVNTFINLSLFLIDLVDTLGYKINLTSINYYIKINNIKNGKMILNLEDLNPLKNNYDNKIKSIKLDIETITYLQLLENIRLKNKSYNLENLDNLENLENKIPVNSMIQNILSIENQEVQTKESLPNEEVPLVSNLSNISDQLDGHYYEKKIFHKHLDFFADYISFHLDNRIYLKSLKLLNY